MIESYEDCVVCIVYELVLKSYIVLHNNNIFLL